MAWRPLYLVVVRRQLQAGGGGPCRKGGQAGSGEQSVQDGSAQTVAGHLDGAQGGHLHAGLDYL